MHGKNRVKMILKKGEQGLQVQMMQLTFGKEGGCEGWSVTGSSSETLGHSCDASCRFCGREGEFGACFFLEPSSHYPVIYCARPGSRMWEVSHEGVLPLKFKVNR